MSQLLQWWEVEKLLTEKDKQAISRAKGLHYGEIDENEADTVHGRKILKDMILQKYHNEEFSAGML